MIGPDLLRDPYGRVDDDHHSDHNGIGVVTDHNRQQCCAQQNHDERVV
ncbi:hypothetical protein ACWD4L_49580 [Streptomyces sp. NPDC002596]